ncbi:MAG TPA: hypothetical protein VLT85_06190 [Terriglobales bacterium]|nr:hypothetical protein [Terriglobales bacterium]
MDLKSPQLRRALLLALAALALVYALLAGLRTVSDFDLGWQLATGRWMAEHHQVPRTDVFSYTARGAEWIYPPFSGLLFYLLYRLGGWAALSWLGALTCAATVALLVRRGSGFAALLAIVAVPVLAYRTGPRAEMFTTLLFAVFLSMMWQQYRQGRAPLYWLPPLMLLWVNLHLGFVAGLGVLAAYAGLEVLELPFAARRPEALVRLRRAAPWLLITPAATLLNPWGPRLYAALVRQEGMMKGFGSFVLEWTGVRFSRFSLLQALKWRDPESAYWWLLAAVAVAVVFALWRRRLGAAGLLAGAAWLSILHTRYHGLFACVAVIVAGSLLSEGLAAPAWLRELRLRPALRAMAAAALLVLVYFRASDLVSNRYYLASGQTTLFGAGLSWWFPERATDFLLRERLPGNIFHDYNLGGYLTWRIGPQYPDYIDGRAVPFGAALFYHHRSLMQQAPDSPAWQQEADSRGINVILVSAARYAGLGGFPIAAFCQSGGWRPVYLDDVSVIFLRNRPENAAWLDRLSLDCARVPLPPPPAPAGESASRRSAELYNFYSNAGAILYVLNRDPEALADFDRAQAIFSADPNLHLFRGQLLQAENRLPEAEQEYRTAVGLRPSDAGWFLLARLDAAQHRYAEAAQALANSARLSTDPADRYRTLGQIYLVLHQPEEALAAFGRAERSSPYKSGEASAAGAEFQAQIAEGRARAWRDRNDLTRAVQFQEQAVKFTPDNPVRWMALAALYDAQGRPDLAAQARQRAQQAQMPGR